MYTIDTIWELSTEALIVLFRPVTPGQHTIFPCFIELVPKFWVSEWEEDDGGGSRNIKPVLMSLWKLLINGFRRPDSYLHETHSSGTQEGRWKHYLFTVVVEGLSTDPPFRKTSNDLFVGPSWRLKGRRLS